MSLHDLYIWLAGLDVPSLSAIWTWLITVPWWMAVGTVMFIVFAVRFTWSLTFYFINWLFAWTFKAGVRFGEWLHVAKRYMTAAVNLGRLLKQKLLR
jgi:hypothetical protein